MGWEEAEKKVQDESPFDSNQLCGFRKEFLQLWLVH